MKYLYSALLLPLVCTISYAQLTSIEGQITDSSTGAPVPYATVQIKNSFSGTVANEEGIFSLLAHATDSIKISCIGYESITHSAEMATNLIILTPKTTILKTVTVFDKMPKARAIVRKAFRSIKKNYISDPFTMKTFYRHYCRDDSVYGRLIEAAVDVYKGKGYSKPKEYEESNKDKRKLRQLRRSFDKTLLVQKSHAAIAFDKVLSADLVGYQGSANDHSHFFLVMESQNNLKRNIREYEFDLAGVSTYDGYEVYIIDYTTKYWQDTISTTGLLTKIKHKGKLYIRADNYAFLKHENYVSMNDDLIVTKDKVYYQQASGKYYLSHVIHDNIISISKDSTSHQAHIEILVNKIKIGKDKKFIDEAMTEKVLAQSSYAPDFWKTYTVIAENPLEQQIRLHLEKNEPLTEQYLKKAEKRKWHMEGVGNK